MKFIPPFTALTIFLLSFLCLGQHPVSPWDEARTGVNAIEMLKNGDWANLHYAGQPDTWRAKPPFVVWLVAVSFKIFGFNELALRLPAALAIVLAFFFIFKIITLYRSEFFAACTMLMLASVNGLIGWHVGRTGDFDAMLVCFLVAGTYFFLRNLDFGEKTAIFLWGLLWGTAFLVKGPAAGVLVPGVILYAIFTGRFNSLAKAKEMWLAVFIAMLFPLGWFLTQHFFGLRVEQNGTFLTSFDRLFDTDLWTRFTQSAEGWKEPFDVGFFFYSLDKSFNLWHLVFFGLLAFGLFKMVKSGSGFLIRFLKNEKHRLLVLSLCLYFPLAIFLTIAAKSNRWYLAPALPFVGIATFFGIRYFWVKYYWVKYAFAALLIFTLGRRFFEILTPRPRPAVIVENAEKFSKASAIVQVGPIEQDLLLYLYFQNRNLVFSPKQRAVGPGEVLFVHKFSLPTPPPENLNLIGESKDYRLFSPNF